VSPVVYLCYNTHIMNPVISFESVSKRFIVHRERARSFQDLAVNILHRKVGSREVFWALKDVNLAISQGEFIGLIGPNGAGKSTLLKLMTRILEPTSGTVRVQGRIAALLELGTGFHPDLTGRENVFLNGSLLGFSRRQMQQRLDSIIEFAGMERFIDMPVRHYSSGMYMRLGFAIAVHSDPDILITDEVLAVGDEAFQHKCLERMSKFRDDGVTIVLVSHALPMVRHLCDRVIWLRQGSIVMDGEPDVVVDSYIADVAANGRHLPEATPVTGRHNTPVIAGLADARLLGVELIGPEGRCRWEMKAGERMTLRVHYHLRQQLANAVISLQIHDANDQTVISGFNTYAEQGPLILSEGRNYVDLTDLPWPLRQGHYLLSVALFSRPDEPAWANPDDLHHKAYTLTVNSPLLTPQRRWGTGEVLLDRVRLCNEQGIETTNFATGETLRLHLRCSSTKGSIVNPVLRVQIFRASDGVLCHATNTDRSGLKLGHLSGRKEVVLTYDHLNLLEGDYVLSVGVWPAEDARLPYDWHDTAYAFHISSEHKHGGGLVALTHRWSVGGEKS